MRYDKGAGGLDLFIFMIMAIIFLVMFGMFIFMGQKVTTKLHEEMPTSVGGGNANVTEVINQTMGKTSASFNALYWVSIFLIFGMAVGIFIGSYLVTTKPVFMIPYIFMVIIAIIVAVGISNGYETMLSNVQNADADLDAVYDNFTGGNWILLHLPIIIAIIGMGGAIIMFARMGSREVNQYGY